MSTINNHIISYAAHILDRIEREKVRPRSRWYFILKNEAFWGMGVVSVIIGSCSVAAILFAFSYAEVDFYTATHDSLAGFILDTLPVIWLASLILFLGIGYVQIRNTSRGYKYPFGIILSISLGMSVAGGVALYVYGLGDIIERTAGPYIPFHNPPQVQRQHFWVNANRGIIAGEVIDIKEESDKISSFTIKDFGGRMWVISGEYLGNVDIEILNTHDLVRVIGLPVQSDLASELIGTTTDTSFDLAATGTTPSTIALNATGTMYACFVLPWVAQDMNLYASSSGQNIDQNYTPNIAMATATLRDLAYQKQSAKNEITSERKIDDQRSNECKAVRPYQLVERLRAEARY